MLGKAIEISKKDEMLLRKMYSCRDIAEPYIPMKCKYKNIKYLALVNK